MGGRSLVGIAVSMLVVLGTIYLYNKFVAKDGKTIANLGAA